MSQFPFKYVCMNFNFDLISDLHTQTWADFDWHGAATSQICVLAGDVAKDPKDLEKALKHLTECYQAVFYIDGNEEHKHRWDAIGSNIKDIERIINRCPGVVYLHDNVVIINGVAILGANGWWTWDFDSSISKEDSQSWFSEHYHCDDVVTQIIDHLAKVDTHYLTTSVEKLQTHPDVKHIAIVTHTLPGARFIEHDVSIVGTPRINSMGNSYMDMVLAADTENKISHWCFGHYHGSVDRIEHGIRYVNNCRGRGDTPWRQSVYHPLRIEINF
jgi:predicted phosphohydrolase